MSNPPSTYAPIPYFSGIIYNPTDFIENSTTAVLTYAEALKLFLQKNTPIPLLYSPNNLTSETQLGYSIFDTITNTSALPSGVTSSVFTSNIALPTGVWLITYSIRIQSVAVMNGIALNLYGVDNINGTNLCYGQTNLTPSATTSIGGTGTFIIKSGVNGVNVYNINCYVAYTTGSASILTTGSFQSNVQRTRIA